MRPARLDLLFALGPLLLGQIRFGSQEVKLLENIGRFLGGLLIAAGVA